MVVLFHMWLMTVSLFNIFASVCRLVRAFALDKGLPFHNLLTYVCLTALDATRRF
jgi:hypothetical protein